MRSWPGEETFGPGRAGHRSRVPGRTRIALTDDLPYGLMASIYTANAGTGLRYADAVRAGWVNINESSNYWETHLPFGGGGGSASGVGRRRLPLEALSQVRTVVLSGLTWSSAPLAARPSRERQPGPPAQALVTAARPSGSTVTSP